MRCGVSVCLIVLGLSPWAIAQTAVVYIEQEIVREQVEGQPALKGTQKLWYSERFIRNETRFGDKVSVALFDLEKGRITLIPGPQKQYVELGLADYQRLVAMRLASSGLNDDAAAPSLKKTEEVRSISGWKCRKYVFVQGGRLPIRADLWVAQDTGVDFAAWLSLMEKLGLDRLMGRMSVFVRQIDGYPIEVRTEQSVFDQKLVSTTRVRKLVRQDVEPALFLVPDDYLRMEAELSPTDDGKTQGEADGAARPVTSKNPQGG